MFGAVYVGMPLGMLVAVQALQGWSATLLLLGTIVVSDSSQYYVGRMFGKTTAGAVDQPEEDDRRRDRWSHLRARAFMVFAGAKMLPFVGYAPLFVLGILVVGLGHLW